MLVGSARFFCSFLLVLFCVGICRINFMVDGQGDWKRDCKGGEVVTGRRESDESHEGCPEYRST